MKKKRLNKVLNIVVTLMAAIALMLGNVTSVAAYTSLDGYPFKYEYMYCLINHGIYDNVASIPMTEGEQNTYYGNVGTLNNVLGFCVGNNANSFVFPYQPDIYDYYLVGTFGFAEERPISDFDVTSIEFKLFRDDMSYYYRELFDLNVYDFTSYILHGKSISAKIPDNLPDSNFGNIYINTSEDSVFSGDMHFSFSVVPVPKSGTESDTLNSILQTLNKINQNIITGNTLQQQTIDAINQNTTNTSNWFTTLITTMQGWYNTQTENLRTWFYMIEERMSAGFTALYHQMTREQDEKLNGYTDTTQSDAADSFNTESDKLTELEDQLNDQSHDFVSDYTTSGFNTGVLTTLSSSIIFVATWFANFWNMGGIFTSGLNFCFSLSIVFFILRFRR